jgi:transcriptional regulator with AAA-type ATPase domain
MTIAAEMQQAYLFQGIPPSEVEKAAPCAQEASYEPGEYIYKAGDSGQAFYIIAEGKVELTTHEKGNTACVYGHISAGGHFGEVSLLTGRPRSLSARAITKVRVLLFDQKHFENILLASPLIHRALDRALAERLIMSSKGEKNDLFTFQPAQEQADPGAFHPSSLPHRGADHSVEKMAGDFDFSEDIDLTKKIRRQVKALAADPAPVLITGESGTGRLLVAKQIHLYSREKAEPYVELDLLQHDQWIWEGKLFGYEQDAFPYSPGRQLGVFEQLNQGTAVLYHAENLDKGLQKKLYDALTGGMFSTVEGKGEQPFTMRLIFITGSTLETLQKDSVFIPELISLLSGRILSLPPLREHRKDIAPLVDYYLKQYSTMHNKNVTTISPDALGLMMKYDWPGNLTELSNVIHRAVMVSQQDEIISEQILLGLPRSEGRLVYNLLRLPKIRQFIAHRLYPALPRIIVFIILGIGMITLFLGPQEPEKNLGLTLSWYIGWPLLITSFFFLPRFWCSVCALSAPGKLVQNFIEPTRRVPAIITANSSWIMAIFCLAVFWVEIVWNAYDNPWLTGMILLTITAGALLFSVLFQRYAWCRYVCPLGGLNAIFSMPSILELRANRQMCENQCTDHACYRGNEDTPGCPMFRHPFLVDNNKDCILCGRCIKNCRYRSTQLNLRLAPEELWSIQSPRLADSFLVVTLGAIYFLLTGHKEFQAIIQQQSLFHIGSADISAAVTGSLMFWGIVALGWTVYSFLCRIQAAMTDGDYDKIRAAFGYGLIPLVLGGYLAFYAKMFFHGAWRLIPNVLYLFGIEATAEKFQFISKQGITTLLHISIIGGLFACLYATYRIFNRLSLTSGTLQKASTIKQLTVPYLLILLTGIAYLIFI